MSKAVWVKSKITLIDNGNPTYYIGCNHCDKKINCNEGIKCFVVMQMQLLSRDRQLGHHFFLLTKPCLRCYRREMRPTVQCRWRRLWSRLPAMGPVLPGRRSGGHPSGVIKRPFAYQPEQRQRLVSRLGFRRGGGRRGICPVELDLLASFLDSIDQPLRALLVHNIKPKRMQMPWRDSSNKVDSVVFAMRHMESYIGQRSDEWDCGLIRGDGE